MIHFELLNNDYGSMGPVQCEGYCENSPYVLTLPDSANREECFDISGRITWQKGELGIITCHEYDVVSGLEIRTIQHVDADTMRITEYGYDWRGRRIHVHNEEDENGLSIYNLTTYDNLDRTIKTERYLSLDPVPDRLLARTETFYDMRGNVWKTEQSIVNPADGTVQGKLLARSWFDAAGRTIRTQALGENRATVTAYDSLGRVVSAAIQLDEVVFEKTETSYDDLGHVLQTAFSQRLADGFGFRTSYTANWYDPAGRSVASANYGALASFTRPATVPERSDDTLVTTTFYDSSTGDPLKTIDPAGRETRTFTDALGRTVKTVSNFTDGTISAARPDCNVTVLYTYHPSGQVETMTVKNPVTGDQITRYAYSLGRLTHEFYPDSSSPTDCVSYTYNRLGERTSKRDQNGTVHAYTYDNLGRMVADTVTQFGDSIDRTVQKITTSYTPDGKTASITSHGANDTILNQISYEYDACGLLSKEWQSLLGDPATLYTGYTYDTTQTEGYFTKKLRPTGYVFPDGWNCFYGYDNTYDDLFNRPTRIHSLTVTQVEYQYMGIQTPVVTKYPVPGLTLDYTNGLDRFGRIIRHSWKNAASQPVVEIHHDYDRSGNRLNRTDIAAGAAFNESYQYDQQNQMIDLDRTDCHEHFHYDTTGNWLAWRHNDTIQNRTHNPANEIVSIDNSDVCVRTDAAGNMTRIPNPKAGIVRADYSSVFCVTRRFAAPRRVEPESLNLTYDAWNRLVRVAKPAGNLVAEYRYDGLNRRVLKTTSCETRRFYYNRNWQCVQETVEDQPTIHYTWGLRYVDDLVCRHTDTTPIYSLADANWNVVTLTDATGTPVERYTYNAFGKLNIYDGAFTPRSASNYNWTRTFTGQVLDHETGLMLYRNRYYAPDLGRFVICDPIGYGGGHNFYRYVNNAPLFYLDSYGLDEEACMCDKYLEQAKEILEHIEIIHSLKYEDFRVNKKCLPRISCHCKGNFGEADAYTTSQGIVCLNSKRFNNLPTAYASSFMTKLTALIIHELVHVRQDKTFRFCNNKEPEKLPDINKDMDTVRRDTWQAMPKERACKLCQDREKEAYTIQGIVAFPFSNCSQYKGFAKVLCEIDNKRQMELRKILIENGLKMSCSHVCD